MSEDKIQEDELKDDDGRGLNPNHYYNPKGNGIRYFESKNFSDRKWLEHDSQWKSLVKEHIKEIEKSEQQVKLALEAEFNMRILHRVKDSRDDGIDETLSQIFDIFNVPDKPNEDIPKIEEDPFYERLIFIAAFFSLPDRQDEMEDYLETRYRKNLKKHKANRARRLLMKDVALSILPIFITLARTRVVRVLTTLGLMKIMKYFF